MEPVPTFTVATTVLLLSEITLTVFEFALATKTSPFPLSYATPQGPVPTFTVATTVLLLSEITLTLFVPELATKISPLPLSYATPWGLAPPQSVGRALPVYSVLVQRSRVYATEGETEGTDGWLVPLASLRPEFQRCACSSA